MQEWQTRAACVGMDTEIWFPEGNSIEDQAKREHAKRICCRCPVRVTCLNWAIRQHIEHGIWGGMTAAERETLREHRRRGALWH